MPRPPRVEYEGALYHVTSRGNGRQVIFHSDRDRLRFLDQLQDNIETFGVELYAYVLMSNHYHLLVRTRHANLSRFVQRLNTSYGLYYRYKHARPGHVFQGRYKAKLVEGDEYLLRLTRYIHLNPVKTREADGLTREERVERVESYAWSSYPGYAREARALPWVKYDVLKGYGRSWGEARRRYKAYVHAMVMESDEPLREVMEESAYAIGDEEFVRGVERTLRGRWKGGSGHRDIDLPEERVSLDEISRAVAARYGVEMERLKEHGHVGGEAKVMALELATRVSGLTQREIGAYYGGIGSSAVAMMRRKVRAGTAALQARLHSLLKQFSA